MRRRFLILPVTLPLQNFLPRASHSNDSLKRAARQLEFTFISEMLHAAGADKTREAFGGGAGESAFSSFLTDAQAQAIETVGGFGLADDIYQSLKEGT